MKNKKLYHYLSHKWLLGVASTVIGLGLLSVIEGQAQAAETTQQTTSKIDTSSTKPIKKTSQNKEVSQVTQQKLTTSSRTTQLINTPKGKQSIKTVTPKYKAPNPKLVKPAATHKVRTRSLKSKPVQSKVAPKSSVSSKKVPQTKRLETKTSSKYRTKVPTKAKVTSTSNTKVKTTYPSTQSHSKTSKVNASHKITKKSTNQVNVKSKKTTKITKTKATIASVKTSMPTNTTQVKLIPQYRVGRNITDHYNSMSELLNHTQQGVDWTKESSDNHSRVLIMAPHVGNIERGTTELTKLIAAKGNYDYYAFNGIRKPNSNELHVTSTNYDDPDLINRNYYKDVSVTVHGVRAQKGVLENTVCIGGLDYNLRNLIKTELLGHQFNVQDANGYIAGRSSNNIANFNWRGQGVQLELTSDLRDTMLRGDVMDNGLSVMDNFATAINNAITQYLI
ncbi:hypothetical protein BUY45_01340 [Staphylococcus devriesei]|uniref:Phage-related replication protein n=1 Tax=Staphylococcus devriesei TaxID=586733 RepID=A0A2T4KVS1_9STAP|nr:poly-gamma-glutamate hydrolase family protein [Staphylococcus devriesei]PTF04961.1 hypothetical protein BUY45_01340 [Staphylococcus devriesei]PTF13667.1 hypothetical protein BUY48_08405 [Staphylococcus devriesei]